MTSRTRSPKYPSLPLGKAIDLVNEIHLIERTNPIDREVAAKALGYTGISGRSASVLASLVQYGLLQRTGKNEICVTARAVEILYPDNPQSKDSALKDAAKEPELFQRVIEKFTDGLPSDNALKSFLVKEGFTNAAMAPAVTAFKETFSFLENTIESGSYWNENSNMVETQLNQLVEEEDTMQSTQQNNEASAVPQFTMSKLPDANIENGPEIHFAQKKIWLGGVISSRSDAQEIIATITALMPMLKESSKEVDEDFHPIDN